MDNEKIFECSKTHNIWQFEDYEVILAPYPHYECPDCGEWFPVF